MTTPVPAVPGAINIGPPLTGNEIVAIATGGPQSAQTTTRAIADLAGTVGATPALNSLLVDGNGTLTAAMITGGSLVRTGPTTAVVDTTDTATAIKALLPNIVSQEAFQFRYINGSNNEIVLEPGTGVFFAPESYVVPANSWIVFTVKYQSNGTFLFYGMSMGYNSLISGTEYSAVTNTSGFTLSTTNFNPLAANVVINLTGTLGADAAVTLPLVTNITAIAPNPATGNSFIVRIINSSSANHVWTVTTNTGWTLNGTMTIAQNTYRDFIATVTNVLSSTATLQQIGTGTTS